MPKSIKVPTKTSTKASVAQSKAATPSKKSKLSSEETTTITTATVAAVNATSTKPITAPVPVLATDPKAIKAWLEHYKIENYTITPEGVVNVAGSVNLFKKGLSAIGVQFGSVAGEFDISHNQLTSLKGAPRIVDGNFMCPYNQIQSLEFTPEFVKGNFNCSFNDIENLMYFPKDVERYFFANKNPRLTEIAYITSFLEIKNVIRPRHLIELEKTILEQGLSPKNIATGNILPKEEANTQSVSSLKPKVAKNKI